MSPIEIYLAWFNQQATETKEDLGLQIELMLPGNVDESRLETPSLDVVALVRALTEWAARDPMQNVGLTLSVAALTEFVLARRSSVEKWTDVKQMNEHYRDEALEEGQRDVAAKIGATLQKMPLREKRWLHVANTWSELRSAQLSNKAIDEWLLSALVARQLK
ncbi:MAG TPA: hypothetical protein VH062_00420 [Polyangiaceae bacterium]|jgi:hypothetical protein|nr:hypothetical protein [Polyangiaceae bacterium]